MRHEPITITSLNIASSSDNNYANANKTITLTLVTDGTDLGNFTGTLLGREFTNITTGGSANFTVTVRANDTNENAIFSITMTNSNVEINFAYQILISQMARLS